MSLRQDTIVYGGLMLLVVSDGQPCEVTQLCSSYLPQMRARRLSWGVMCDCAHSVCSVAGQAG